MSFFGTEQPKDQAGQKLSSHLPDYLTKSQASN